MVTDMSTVSGVNKRIFSSIGQYFRLCCCAKCACSLVTLFPFQCVLRYNVVLIGLHCIIFCCQTLREAHDQFKASLSAAEADFNQLAQLDKQIKSFNVGPNPYTWFTMEALEDTWRNLQKIIRVGCVYQLLVLPCSNWIQIKNGHYLRCLQELKINNS